MENLTLFGALIFLILFLLLGIAIIQLAGNTQALIGKPMRTVFVTNGLMIVVFVFWAYTAAKSSWVYYDMGGPDYELWDNLNRITGWISGATLTVTIGVLAKNGMKGRIPWKPTAMLFFCSVVIIATSALALLAFG